MRLPKKIRLLLLLLVMVLSVAIIVNIACKSSGDMAAEEEPPPPPPDDEQTAAEEPPPYDDDVEMGMPEIELTISKYLFKNEDEDPDFGLFSYFLMPRKPITVKDTNRYILTHQAFKTLISYAEYRAEAGEDTLPHENINVSYWPINVENDYTMEAEDISRSHKPDLFYVENYNYVCAKLILMKVPDLSGNGPYIISYADPLRNIENIDSTKQMLVIDMSRIEDSLLVEMVDYFQRKVADNPDTWQDGFDWDLIKLKFYSALKIHGRPVIYAATWVKDFFGLKNIFGSG